MFRLEWFMIKGYHYRASTRLSYQSFDNCLEDEPQVGTTIRQSLAYNPFHVEFFANYPVQSLKLVFTSLVIFFPNRSGFPICHSGNNFDWNPWLETSMEKIQDNHHWNCLFLGISIWTAHGNWSKGLFIN